MVMYTQHMCMLVHCGKNSTSNEFLRLLHSTMYDRLTCHAGFFVVYHFFGLPSTASLGDLEREGRRHCALDWEPLNAARGAEIHMDQYCFRCDLITTPSGHMAQHCGFQQRYLQVLAEYERNTVNKAKQRTPGLSSALEGVGIAF